MSSDHAHPLASQGFTNARQNRPTSTWPPTIWIGTGRREEYTERMNSELLGEVNYDSDPVLEVTVGEVEYRLDAGKQGTALCVFEREPGTGDWRFVAGTT